MDENPSFPEVKPPSGVLILPSLVLSRFATGCPGILTGLLLIDIGLTFGVSVGIMGQIRTASSIVGVISALLMGVLSIRFKHKSLLMIGLSFILVSALGCSFALNFNMILLFFLLTGLGMAMITPMTATLVAERFPLDKRGSAIGWLVAGGSLSYVIGAQVITFIAGIRDWRMAFLGFVVPILVMSLVLVMVGLPSKSSSHRSTMSEGDYLGGFKAVFTKRSATACIFGTVLRMASFQMLLLYSVSFFRQRFLISTGSASIVMTGAALCYTLGSLVIGRFVDRFGRKPLTVLATFLAGVSTISLTLLPNLWLALAMMSLGAWFSGMNVSAAQSLTLEQVPRYRGTMMSMDSAAMNIGTALGAGIGGFVLLLYDWEFVGISLGAIGIIAAVVYYLFVIDPTRT